MKQNISYAFFLNKQKFNFKRAVFFRKLRFKIFKKFTDNDIKQNKIQNIV